MKNLVSSNITNLSSYYETNNDKTLNETVINEIWHPNNEQSKETISTLANLKSLEEVEKLFYDMFENDQLSLTFDDAKKVLDKMAKEEFIYKSKLKELMRN